MASYEVLSASEAQDIAGMVNKCLTMLGVSLNRLASQAGVSQPMAYGASMGRLKRRTPNVRRLELYIHIALGLRQAPDVLAIDQDIMSYLAAGGDVSTLRIHIQALAQAQRSVSR